jgi:hypothetical protein
MFKQKIKSVALVRKRTIPSDRRLSAKLVPTFVNRGCRVVSATDPHGRTLGFLDRSRYYFFQISPQLYAVLTSLSGPRCRPTTSPLVPGIELGTSGSVARNS